MWVRSQDKKSVGDYMFFEIGNELLGKKHYIFGETNGGLFSKKRVCLATYDNKELAISAFEKLQNAIKEMPNGTYEM